MACCRARTTTVLPASAVGIEAGDIGGAGDEAAGQRQVDRGKIEQRAVLVGHGKPGDQRIALVVAEGVGGLFPGPGLDGAGDIDLGADALGQVDIEADQFAAGIAEVEGREIGGGEEADGRDRRQAGQDFAGAGIGVIGQRLGEGGGGEEGEGQGDE